MIRISIVGKFPNHCGGVGYVTTMTVIDRIVNEISKYFLGDVCTHEDVFMTLVVPRHINSSRRYFWRKPEPIRLVNRYLEWISLDLEDGRGDEDHFLVNFLRQTNDENEIENLNEFRRRYFERIFYLFAHSDDFEDKYRRLWRVIENGFSK